MILIRARLPMVLAGVGLFANTLSARTRSEVVSGALGRTSDVVPRSSTMHGVSLRL